MKNKKWFIQYLLPPIIWALAIFIQSSFSSIIQPDIGFKVSDKVGHAIIYAILGFLITRALTNSTRSNLRQYAIIISIIIASLYGLSDEIHQYLVPGRTCELGDLVADIIGVSLAQSIFYIRKQPAYRQMFSRKLPKD